MSRELRADAHDELSKIDPNIFGDDAVSQKKKSPICLQPPKEVHPKKTTPHAVQAPPKRPSSDQPLEGAEPAVDVKTDSPATPPLEPSTPGGSPALSRSTSGRWNTAELKNPHQEGALIEQ